MSLTDIRTRGVRYAGPVGVELQGWLRAREAGRYQIGAEEERSGAQGFDCWRQRRLTVWAAS